MNTRFGRVSCLGMLNDNLFIRPPIEPTPAAARSLNHSDRTDRPLQGVLKILIDGSNKNSYLKLHEDGYGEVTKNTNEALRFRCNSLSNATLMEQIVSFRRVLISYTSHGIRLQMQRRMDHAILG